MRDAAAGFSPRVLSRDAHVVAARIAGGRVALATAIHPPGGDGDHRDVRIDVLRLEDGGLEYSVTAETPSSSSTSTSRRTGRWPGSETG